MLGLWQPPPPRRQEELPRPSEQNNYTSLKSNCYDPIRHNYCWLFKYIVPSKFDKIVGIGNDGEGMKRGKRGWRE
jgi:hypothetical protein